MGRGSLLALMLLTLVSTAVRLGWSELTELNKDEGYNSLYVSHPDWSYFDHPPMMMLVAKIGIMICGGVSTPLSIRLGFVLLFGATSWVLAAWTAGGYGDRAGFFAALLFHVSPFFLFGAGASVMPDGPFLFFAILTIWALTAAFASEPGRLRPWLLVGGAWAGALLSKYHAIFLPAGAVLFVLLTPSVRRHLLRPGPYLATVIGTIGFIPVLLWNAQHGWASFVFQGGRAFGNHWHPIEVGSLLLGEIVLLSPGLWALLLLQLGIHLYRWRTLERRDCLAVCLALFPLAFFLAISAKRHVAPHWALVGFIPLYPMLGAKVAEWSQHRPHLAVASIGAWSLVLVSAAFLFGYHSRFGLIRMKNDPTWEIGGWDSVIAELKNRDLIDRPNTFVFSGCWHVSGRLGYELEGRVPVLCYNRGDARGFAFWSRPEEWVGKEGILVCLDDIRWEPELFQPYFRRIEPIAEFPLTRAGQPLRHARIFRCVDQTQPFPYTYGANFH